MSELKELKTLDGMQDYEMLVSFKQRSFFGKIVYHYIYKGLIFNAHISWMDAGTTKHWVVSSCKGENETFEELDFAYTGSSKEKAIEEAKSILGRVIGEEENDKRSK